MSKSKITLSQLETFLMKAGDILRSSMDSSEYKEFIFGMLFIKRLSIRNISFEISKKSIFLTARIVMVD